MKLTKSLLITAIALLTFSYGTLTAENKTDAAKTLRPKKPTMGIIDLTTTKNKNETVVIKEGDTEEYMFKVIQDIAVDSKNNLYILGNRRILQYDRNGKFLRTIGGIGEGPGEYNYPRQLFIGPKDHLYVLDVRKIFHYNDKGVFIKHFLVDSSPHGGFFVPAPDSAFGVARRFTGSAISKSICKIDLNAGKTTHLFSVPDPETKFRRTKSGTGGVMFRRNHPYSSKLFLAPITNKGFCFVGSFDDKIRVADFSGNITRIIELEIAPKKVDSKDLEAFEKRYGKKAMKHLNLPPVRPIIENLLTDPAGRIYVVLKKSFADKSPLQSMDVFSSNGDYLYRIKLNALPHHITNGYIFTVATTGEDQYLVKRIKLPTMRTSNNRPTD